MSLLMVVVAILSLAILLDLTINKGSPAMMVIMMLMVAIPTYILYKL